MGVLDAVGDSLRKAGFFGPSVLPKDGKAFRRVVLLRLDHIGDGLFTLPALRAARHVFPNAHMTLLAAPWAVELAQPLHFVDAVKPFRAPWFERGKTQESTRQALNRLSQMLKDGSYDLAIDFRGDARHILAMYLSGIPTRIGYGATGGGCLLTKELLLVPTRHEVESNLDLLRVFQPSLGAYSMPSLPASPDAVDRIEALYRQEGWPWKTRLVLLQFAAGYPSKDWGDQRFAELATQLMRKGHSVALVGSEKERARGEAILKSAGKGLVNWCGKTRLGDLTAMFVKAGLYVGLDSGPSHLALAMKTPSVLLYGDVNDVRRWGPWTKGREERTRVFHGTAPCGPCGRAKCNQSKHDCMQKPTVAQVVRTAEKLMGKHH
jgi:ADP-heptose:LPS heptosyltransferase